MKTFMLVTLLVSGVSFAGTKAESTFKTLDKDSDGNITTAEAAGDAELSAQFATLDKDANGSLSADEFKAHTAAPDQGKKSQDHQKTK